MALYKLDGFDLWSAPSAPSSGSPFTGDTSGQVSLSSSVVAFSDTASKSAVFDTSLGSNSFLQFSLPSVSAIVLGFNFQIPSGVAGHIALLDLQATTIQIYLYIDSSGILHLYDNTDSVSLGSGTTAVLPGQWYHIDVKFTISSSTSSGACVVDLDGSTEISVTSGTNTGGSGTFTVGSTGAIAITLGASGSSYIDDFYIFDTTGGSDNSPFGPSHVHSVAPSTLSLVTEGTWHHGVASDSGSFTGTPSSHAARAKSASSSATFTGTPSSTAKRVTTASDSATFTPLATSGNNQPTGFTGFVGNRLSRLDNMILAFGAVYGRFINVSASDSFGASSGPSGRDVGNRIVSTSSGAQFVGRAASTHKPSVSASDSATFTGNLAIKGHFTHAADSARFTDSATCTARLGRAADSFSFHSVATAGRNRATSAADHALFSDLLAGHKPTVIQQHVADSFYFIRTFASVHDTKIKVSASDGFTFSDDAESDGFFHFGEKASDRAFFYLEKASSTVKRSVGKGVSDSATFSDVASISTRHARHTLSSDTARFSDSAGSVRIAAPLTFSLGFADGGRFSDATSAVSTRVASASDSADFSSVTVSAKGFDNSASDSAAFTDVAGSNQFLSVAAEDTATFTGTATKTVEHLSAKDSATFTGVASASVLLPSGLTIPGGDQSAGLRQILYPSVSQSFPFSYAETPEGILLMMNGFDPPIAWDGYSNSAWTAGVSAPDQVVWLSKSGDGTLLGRRWAYMRYVDSRGNYGNLSQLSDPIDLGRDGFINGVSYDSAGTVLVQAVHHDLATGDVVTISGVRGLAAVNGTFAITVVDNDHFTLAAVVVTGGAYDSGGVWTNGVAAVVYGNLERPEDPKIVRRQILRNLAGDSSVFYVDIDATDLTSTTLSSSQTDEQLATCIPVPILWANQSGKSNRVFQGDSPAAMRFGAPPSHKRAIACYAGRLFAGSDLAYSEGNVSVTAGSPYVLGYGTSFRRSLVGRLLYVPGSGTNPATIEAVIEDQQVLQLSFPYGGPSGVAVNYAIKPPTVERSLIYYSEPHLPESWPSWNAISIPESDDEITGLQVFKSFLYILKDRNIFKFAYKEDPARDGFVFPCVRRGCVNNRCAVYVDDSLYMLDEMGVHKFDGDNTEPVSKAVGSIFKPDGTSKYQVDWTADRTLWHAAHDQVRHTIRWFVSFVGYDSQSLAICYDYRGAQWWIESYAESITSSTLGTLGSPDHTRSATNGYRRSLLGTTARRVFAHGMGSLDGIYEDSGGTLRGSVSATSDTLTITDECANFPSNLAGVPVALVDGTGAGQTAVVSANTSTTLTLVRPLAVAPDETTTYQVGGVPWLWKSGWRRFTDDESENPRDVEFLFRPAKIDASSMDVQLFYDHNSEPESQGYGMANDGIFTRDDSPHAVFDLTKSRGYIVHRLAGHRDPYGYGRRYVSIQMSGAQGVDPTLVYQITVDGVE